MTLIALDTSAAIAFLVRSHEAHAIVAVAVAGHEPAVTAHSLAESYSVLTRLPGDARLLPSDAARLLEAGFAQILTLPDTLVRSLPRQLADADIAGGAVYDALVALAAREAGATLLTRDRRAAATYAALAVPVRMVAGTTEP